MAWTNPTTRTTGEKITDTIWNTDLVDNISFLYAWPYYAKISDHKANNTDGGTFTNGAWRTRDLNTIDNDTYGIVSLAANRFTLQSGTYIILAFAPAANGTGSNKAKLYNVTAAADVIMGDNSSRAVVSACIAAHVFGQFTIAAASEFEIRHQSTFTVANDGFGVRTAFGEDEIYTTVNLWKIA